MNLYIPTAHVQPHQDNLLRDAAAERLARTGRDGEPREGELEPLLLGAIARAAEVVSSRTGRLAAAARARQRHGHARV